jgi:hypothetical protein
VSSFSVAPSSLAFGSNTCAAQDSTSPGTPPAAKTVTISNTSSASAPWTATLTGANASFYTLSAMSGSVPAGTMATPGQATFTVRPIGLSWNTMANANGAALNTGDLLGIDAEVGVTVGTVPNQLTTTVAMSEVPSGAFPGWDPTSLSAPVGTFVKFALTNPTVDAASFTLAAFPPFAIVPTSGPASFGKPLNATVTFTGTMTTLGTITASLADTTGPLCMPFVALPVTGTPGNIAPGGPGAH